MKKLVFIFLFLLFTAFPQKTFAEVIHSFNVDITAHKDGSMDFTETINYDFEYGYRHGIYRYIPLFSKVGDLYRIIDIKNVKVERDGQGESFSKETSKEQIYLKIGKADKQISGDHVYKIYYTVLNGIGSNYQDHDEIYWNITGNGWDVPIEAAIGKIDTDFGVNPTNVICFAGPEGSKDQNCSVNGNSSSAQGLTYGEGLTMVAVYPVSTFPRSVLSKDPPQSLAEKVFNLILANYLYIWIFLNVILAGYLIYWYQKHKNKKRFGPPAVNFDIPKDKKGVVLPPAISGTIDTAKLQREDVTATLYDLAIRKYIKFKEDKTVRKLLPDSVTISIIKLKSDYKDLAPFERQLLDFIFEDGDTVDISTLKTTFYKEFEDMEKSIFSSLVKSGYYTKNPKVQKGVLSFLSVLSFSTLNIILGLVLAFLAKKLNGRTSLGDEVDNKIDGLKIFLKSMDRNYKWQVKNFYTVEQMIPYALALGYIDKFMEALKVNYPDYTPYWYVGYPGNFYSSYSGFNSAVTTNMAPPSSSGSGGGGSSGGGGGGGGGGSW